MGLGSLVELQVAYLGVVSGTALEGWVMALPGHICPGCH